MFDLTVPGIEHRNSRTNSNVVTTELTSKFNYFLRTLLCLSTGLVIVKLLINCFSLECNGFLSKIFGIDSSR